MLRLSTLRQTAAISLKIKVDHLPTFKERKCLELMSRLYSRQLDNKSKFMKNKITSSVD